MAELIALLTLRAEIDVAIERITAFRPILVRPTLPGGRNAGDLLVRMTFDGAAPNSDFGLGSAVAQSDGAIFESIAGAGDPCASPIHRTALFHAGREPTPDRLAHFEIETILMPRRMAFIRGWSLGAVTRAWGRFAWSYVWEQGYDTLEDLTGRYMRHPCHWVRSTAGSIPNIPNG
jgi:hypothetical protein